MDYKELVERLNEWNENLISGLCANDVLTCDDLCGTGDCIVVQAVTAITDLLARAEAAEARVRDLEKLLSAVQNMEKFYPDKTGFFVFTKKEADDITRKLVAAEARAEKAERERDAAISDLTYIARTYPVDLCDDLVCQYCKHYQNVNTGCPGWTENDCFEWRGKKEE